MRRNIIDSRRQARSGLGAGAGGAAAPALPLLDAVVAAGGALPNAAWATHRSLRAGFTTALFRVRNSSTAAQGDISQGADGTPSLADAIALCGANDGYLVTLYDHSGNGRSVTMANTTLQAKIYDGATQTFLHDGGLVGGQWVAASSTRYARADSCGISGAVGVTSWHYGNFTREASDRYVMQIGGGTTGTCWNVRHQSGVEVTNHGPEASFSNTEVRRFTPAAPLWSPHYIVQRVPAGGSVSQISVRQNGQELIQSAVFLPGNTLTMGTSRCTLGADQFGGNAIGGKLIAAAIWGSELTGAALTALETYGRELQETANTKATIILAGQSNAERSFDRIDGTDAEFGNWRWGFCGLDGTSLHTSWAVGGTLYNKLKMWISACDRDLPVWLVWNQGERDAADGLALATAWGANFVTFIDALKTDTGRADLYVVHVTLPTWQVLTHKAQVNAGKASYVAANPSTSQSIDTDVDPVTVNSGDNLHYSDPATEVAMIAKYQSIASAVY